MRSTPGRSNTSRLLSLPPSSATSAMTSYPFASAHARPSRNCVGRENVSACLREDTRP